MNRRIFYNLNIYGKFILLAIVAMLSHNVVLSQSLGQPEHDDHQFRRALAPNLSIEDNADGLNTKEENSSTTGLFDRYNSNQTCFEWENLGLHDEAGIPSGSVLTANGVNMTIDWQTQTNGGNFCAYYGHDYVSYEAGSCAGDYGIASLGFKAYDDPNEKIVVTLTFSEPITGLNFSIIDIDTNSYSDDGVEIFYNGTHNVKGTSYVTSYGHTVCPDNESYMEGFEGNGNCASGSDGNVNLDFGQTEVTSITIKYFPTDDGCNFSSYFAGISDLCFDPAPVECEDNLLQNPGFESCSFSGWNRYLGDACITSHANSGNYAAKLKKRGKIYQDIHNLTPGDTYTFTASGKVTDNCHGQFGIKIYSDSGCNNVIAHESVTVTSSDYQTYTVTITVPDNAQVMRVYGYRGSDGCSSHSWFNWWCGSCHNCEFYIDDTCLTVDNQPGQICGQVRDEFGVGVESALNLLDSQGNILETTTTGQDGIYCFNDVEPGNYTIEQEQPDGYDSVADQDFTPDGDVSDNDTTVDNNIDVTITSGEVDNGNDFVETLRVIRTPCDDNLLTNGDFENGDLNGWNFFGDYAISDMDYNTGNYAGRIGEGEGTLGLYVYDVIPGQVYNFWGYAKNESLAYNEIVLVAYDENDNEVARTAVNVNSLTYDEYILSLEIPMEADYFLLYAYKAAGAGYLYIDDFCLTVEQPPFGNITGLVRDVDGNGIPDVTINLLDKNENSIGEVITAQDGTYTFTNIAPGNYIVEQTQPDGYESVSDQDESNDGDTGDSDTTVDNRIAVTLQPGETDADNNFVEEAITLIPGEIAIEQTISPRFIFDEAQDVEFRYVVTNPGTVPMADVSITSSAPCQQAVGYDQLQSGDTNNDGLLDPNEEWIYSSICNFKWVVPETINYIARVEGVDPLGVIRSDVDVDPLTFRGSNMEVQVSQSVAAPGDVITVRLIVRLLRTEDYVQLRNVEIATNLIDNSTFMPAGPVSPYWVDPTDDVVNPYPGAHDYALDGIDGADYGEYADWVHEFQYTIPENAPSELLIEGFDIGDISRYDAATDRWETAYYQWSYDSKVIEIIGGTTSKNSSEISDNPFGNQRINIQLPTNANYNDSDYRSNMKVDKPNQLVDEVNYTKVQAVPNPATEYVKLINSEKFTNGNFTITNMFGQIVMKGKLTPKAEINIQNLTTGNYVIQLAKDGKLENIKLLVK